MCYENLISISDCANGEKPPITGIYLDVLTGITTVELDQIITTQYPFGLDLFNDKRKTAWQLMVADIVNRLSPKVKADTITANNTIGYIAEGVVNDALGSGNWVGLKIQMSNPKSFMDLVVSYLKVLVPSNTGLMPIRIVDLDSGDIIEEFKINANDRTFKGLVFENPRSTRNFALVYESLFDATRTILRKNYSCGTCNGGYSLFGFDQFVKATGIKLTFDINDKVATEETVGYTYGLILDYTLSCSRNAFLCSIGKDLGLPLGYLTSAQIMDYSIHISPHQRLNNTVTYSKEDNKARAALYMMAYSQQIENITSNMRLPNDPDCFYCDQKTIVREFSI